MGTSTAPKHTCFRCAPHHPDVTLPGPVEGGPQLDTIESTFAEGGEAIFYASGYSAREIAQKHAREIDGEIYVNSISKRIRQPDLTVPVFYAVARSPVYTVRPPDALHAAVYRAYWPPLGK